MTYHTSLTIAMRSGYIVRGDYVHVMCNSPARSRVTNVSVDANTLTIRNAHAWAWVEWLRARWEDWALWPARGSRARMLPKGTT